MGRIALKAKATQLITLDYFHCILINRWMRDGWMGWDGWKIKQMTDLVKDLNVLESTNKRKNDV